ncbi:MAG: dihydroorotase family protein [Candidatus Levybacteria bacterium]|nr:dihydroorotase family protein [Candidatus Levybacteria bacterium]
MITLPGLIDPHVHLRTPGQTHKEDFLTGTSAALAGGYTFVIDMPNNAIPITTSKLLKEKKEIARKQIVADIGFYFGSLGDNLEEFAKVRNQVFGLKLFLNKTTGNFIINKKSLIKIYEAYNINKPILVHAEEDVIDLVIDVCKKTKKKTHVCHVSTIESLQKIIKAKKAGLPITCGVTPHHLFLTKKDIKKLGTFGLMKPRIDDAFSEFVWKNLKWVDCIESDHAPHIASEKRSKQPPFGVPGLETTLGLLLRAVSQDCLSIKEIKRLCYDGPAKLFGIKQNARIEVDENQEWIVEGSKLFTKCKWSPFEGWKLKGRVRKVYIRNRLVFDNGKVLAKPGSTKVL